MDLQNYALDTIKTYRSVCKNFFEFVISNPKIKNLSPSKRMEAYLTHRVQEDDISPSTQNVEFNALLYLHRNVIGVEIENVNALRASPKLRIPPILTKTQVHELIYTLPDKYQLIGQLLYGAGLRVNEALRLRIKDVDLSLNKLVLHQTKGDKERIVPIPDSLLKPLSVQYNIAVGLWRVDHVSGYGVNLPRALEKKYHNYYLSKEWYWLFPAASVSKDPRTQRTQRHHIKDFTIQKSFSDAREALSLPVYATPHSLRHAFATHLAQAMLGQGFPQSMVETKLIEYLGHAGKETLKYYLHLSAPKDAMIVLPIDALPATAK